jgi:glycosyltransferase involved in cell wall biosynthesis
MMRKSTEPSMSRTKRCKRILFISSGFPGNASEELWTLAAMELVREGFSICASLRERRPLSASIDKLKAAGIEVRIRPTNYPLWKRAWLYLPTKGKNKAVFEIERQLRSGPAPDLIVFSNPYTFPPIELIEFAVARKVPFVTISNGNNEAIWPEDEEAERYRGAFATALRCYFVSKANLRLAEKQLGIELPNAEVVWSRYNVDFNVSLPWPSGFGGELRLASVGRLDIIDKGQDILLEALAQPIWKERSWHLTFYGDGPRRKSLERLAAMLGIGERVSFAGYATIEKIWSANHVLVMPSRHEGLPLAIVEAMLCSRPVVATDVGGNTEILADGQTGFLADGPAVRSIAQALERLWDNRANLEDMGKRGAARIRQLAPEHPINLFCEKIKNLVEGR